jgi:hypothetical protein
MVEHRTLATAEPRALPARARGVVYVHAAPRALAPHVEWAIGAVLGHSARLAWTPQPVAPGCLRAEASWTGRPGTAARLISALRTWSRLRVEVTEEPSDGREGERYALTPALGIFRAAIASHGDLQVSEQRLRAALDRTAGDPAALRAEVEALLGAPWDAELEPFRCAGDGAPVRWLHQTG